jgi:TonB family protein
MSAMQINFKVLKEGALLKDLTLTQEVIKIGRAPGCHLQIDDDDVSGTHAVIEVGSAGDVFINDLGGITGTMVNGQPVGRAAINDGDTIAIGDIEVRVTFMGAARTSMVEQFQAASSSQPSPIPGAQAGAPPAIPGAAPSQPPAEPAGVPLAPKEPAAPAGMPVPMGLAPTAMGAAQPVANEPLAPASFPAVAVDLSTVEDVSRQATEVVVMWNGSVLMVNHYTADEKETKVFNIGEDPTCDFPIPPEVLNGQTKLPLAMCSPGGGASVTILPGAMGEVTYDAGNAVPLAEAGATPGSSFNLPAKARVKQDLGSWSFLVNSVPHPRKFVAPMEFDWTSQIYTGFSFLMHAIFLFLIYFIPPDPEGLSLDLLAENNRFIKYMLEPPEVQQDEIPEWLKKDKEDEQQGGKGKRHKGEEGQMGKRDAKKTDNHYGIKGPKDNPDPHMARSMAKEMAKNAGILSYLSAANAPTSPFGRDTALGVDPENALGALMGNQVGENFGYGGLGLRGTGRGGGGTGEGTIGLGNLNTIGHGGGGGSGSGYGRGAGGLGGRRGSVPRIRSGAAMVKGSLSKEVIRRIVHRHINEVKFCYERKLAQRPDLSGRVAIKFIISGTGAVQMAAVASSTLGDPSVENCIAQAVRRWTFPQPEGGGIVIVTYPFQLTAPEG